MSEYTERVATTIHLPDELLRQASEGAAAEGISRNRFIADAVRLKLKQREGWSPGFLRALAKVSPTPGLRKATDEMLAHVRRGRRSRKGPPF